MNPKLFAAQRDQSTDATNFAGGRAYSRSAKESLAQFALTGTLGDTHHASAELHLDDLITLLGDESVEPSFVAKLAIFSRQHGYMKDVPAFLVAWLAFNGRYKFLAPAFAGVVDNGKMLKNVVQVCRSGFLGRRTIPRPLRRLIKAWLNGANDYQLMKAIPGQDPSLADVVKMVHPKADNGERNAFYSYLIGKSTPLGLADLPELVQRLENFKLTFGSAEFNGLPKGIPFQLVDSLPLEAEHWNKLAIDGGWHFVRMNINTFIRHDVFKTYPGTIKIVADKLRDPDAIAKAKVFPYQLFAAFKYSEDAPHEIREALQDAMELAINNVPVFDGQVAILVDVSGSMTSTYITGKHGKRQQSKIRAVDAAALFAAAFLRKNPRTQILPYDTDIRQPSRPLNGRDSVMTNAQLLSMQGGGTATGFALSRLNEANIKADAVLIVSDNESWADDPRYAWHPTVSGTKVSAEWRKFKKRNRKAKLVCLDLTPEKNTQIVDKADSLNVGGFSDNVWTIVDDFLNDRLTSAHVVGKIESLSLSLSPIG